ncbi:MAG: hypothetical protein EBT90_00350 [Rhodobacteraceae bacterium]|nr:hypothetical protein [Paracoccaceae bacterium]
MSQQQIKPEVKGQVSDAVRGNWVDHWAPALARPYLRLSRADRPIGTWLLLIPCWWGVLMGVLATDDASLNDLWIFVSCALGAFLMRGAGCTWNDITDRKFDGAVERTRSRPIPSGQVSVAQAVVWMVIQALCGGFGVISVGLMAIALLGAVGNRSTLSQIIAFSALPAFGAHLVWQLRNLNINSPEVLLTLFRSNRDAGLIPVMFFAAAMLL